MESFKIKFWVNLTLAICTAYIITWYLLTPSNNQCQMTFMMEPPKFLPVPLEDTTTIGDSDLTYPKINVRGSAKEEIKYKLFMYSEFGFPQASDVRRDLRDSMPILFVPGNAGSYQQVRSLASTCIRHQLQSLDAFKFIFYTIDFRNQLSGISGQLIEDQTAFVERSLRQIAKMHPTDTNGIIVIGHSVGGFISKNLFTLPSFDASSVPLMISLASPLTSPFLVFDEKMRELYRRTNKYWKAKKSMENTTIAISISGGLPDRLVPMHLSMDPHYDLSLITSSIKDVWLATDHVCITWCKELMQKLSHLLSALMDKRQTRLISDRDLAISIIKKELLVDMNSIQNNFDVITKDWKSMRSHKMVEFEEYYSETRAQLGDKILIIKLVSMNDDLLIIIDYIERLKENGVFGCSELALNSSDGQINCLGRVDLMQSALVIPSRRYEPKRSTIKLIRDKNVRMKYLVFDFLDYPNGHKKRYEPRLPELLTVQRLDSKLDEELYIPSIIEYSLRRLLFIDKFYYRISSTRNYPLIHTRYRLVNLEKATQIYSIRFKSQECRQHEYATGATIVFSQNGYLTESFHPTDFNEDVLSVNIKITSQQAVRFGRQDKLRNGVAYLDLYIDGTCQNSFEIKLDILALVVNLIQKSLGKIMACTSLFAYISITSSAFNLGTDAHYDKINFLPGDNSFYTKLASFLVIYVGSNYRGDAVITSDHQDYLDQTFTILAIFILSQGMLAFLHYIIKRVKDLAIIINNAQSMIRQKVSQSNSSRTYSQETNGTSPVVGTRVSDFDWLLIVIAILGGFLFSSALVSLFTIFIVIKLELSLNARTSITDKNLSKDENKHCSKATCPVPSRSQLINISELSTNMAVLNVLALLSTIPSALIKFNSEKATQLDSILEHFQTDITFLAASLTLVSVKTTCDTIEKNFDINQNTIKDKDASDTRNQKNSVGLFRSLLKLFSDRRLHLITLAPIMLIESNLCHVLNASVLSMSWLSAYLITKHNSKKLRNEALINKLQKE